MSRHEVGSAQTNANLCRTSFVITSFLLLAVNCALHQSMESRLPDAQNLFPNLEIMLDRFCNDANIEHHAQVDRDGLESLSLAVVSETVLVRVASVVLGLTGVAADAGNGRAEDHEVKRPLVAEILVQVPRPLNFWPQTHRPLLV